MYLYSFTTNIYYWGLAIVHHLTTWTIVVWFLTEVWVAVCLSGNIGTAGISCPPTALLSHKEPVPVHAVDVVHHCEKEWLIMKADIRCLYYSPFPRLSPPFYFICTILIMRKILLNCRMGRAWAALITCGHWWRVQYIYCVYVSKSKRTRKQPGLALVLTAPQMA